MSLRLVIMQAFILCFSIKTCGKKLNVSCLPSCSCETIKAAGGERIEMDCRSAKLVRMPACPMVFEWNDQNRIRQIRLNLSGNRIEHLDLLFLNQWKTLEVLILSQNRLKSLSKSADKEISMRRLKVLDLSSNNIQVLHTFILNGFPSLRTLNLSHNQIHTISNGAFLLPALLELDLSHNQMTEVGSHLFETSPQLEIIRFAHNRISRLLGNALLSIRS